jgi:hypothetical protein
VCKDIKGKAHDGHMKRLLKAESRRQNLALSLCLTPCHAYSQGENMRVAKVLGWLVVSLCGTVWAEGFSVRGAFRAALDTSLNLQAEAGYSDLVLPGLEVGGRLAIDLIAEPTLRGDVISTETSTSVLLYGFAEYRKTLSNEITDAFARGELGVGYLFSAERNTFFPRAVLSTGLEGSSVFNENIKTFGQLKASFEFVPTDRAKLGSAQRVGFIIIPLVPYIASESYYNFINGSSEFSAYTGSLLYFSEQLFIGLDVGIKDSVTDNTAGYARIFTSFTER